jgi:hypothetical protein
MPRKASTMTITLFPHQRFFHDYSSEDLCKAPGCHMPAIFDVSVTRRNSKGEKTFNQTRSLCHDHARLSFLEQTNQQLPQTQNKN